MRLLSWLLLGSLTHMALMQRRTSIHISAASGAQPTNPQNPTTGGGHHHPLSTAHSNSTNQPVPQEASCHIADHIQVIFAGFAEQSKTSVLHMSSLFHAFTLCQLWTVYLEQIAHTSNNPEGNTMGVLFEFWAKVTPSILQLVSHSKHKDSNDFTQNSNAKVRWKFGQIDERHRNLNVYVFSAFGNGQFTFLEFIGSP